MVSLALLVSRAFIFVSRRFASRLPVRLPRTVNKTRLRFLPRSAFAILVDIFIFIKIPKSEENILVLAPTVVAEKTAVRIRNVSMNILPTAVNVPRQTAQNIDHAAAPSSSAACI